MMSSATCTKVLSWSTDQVLSWLNGLDENIPQHAGKFVASSVNGLKLLYLTNGDLMDMGVTKLRDQEIILQSIVLLQKLTFEISNESMKTNAARLEVACQNLVNLIRMSFPRLDNPHNIPLKTKNEIFAAIENVLKCGSNFLSWLDRLENDDESKWDEIKLTVLNDIRSISSYVKKKVTEFNLISNCTQLINLCKEIIQDSRDPLVSQPSSLDVVQLKRDLKEELGLEIRSLYNGVFYISAITPNSVAESSNKFEVKDEIVEVSRQTVVGWDLRLLKKYIDLQEKDVSFTIKKRPALTYLSNKIQKNKKKPIKKNVSLASAEDHIDRSTNQEPLRKEGFYSEENIYKQNETPMDNNNLLVRSVDDLTVSGLRSSKFIGEEGLQVCDIPTNGSKSDSSEGDSKLLEHIESVSSSKKENVNPARHLETNFISDGKLSPSALPWQPHQTFSTSSNEEHARLSRRPSSPLQNFDTFFSRNKSKSSSRINSKEKNKKLGSSFESLLNSGNPSKESDKISLSSVRSMPKILRPKLKRNKGGSKRVSCRDLGGTDCQGWLWVMLEDECQIRFLHQEKWAVYWVVLHMRNVYFYEDPEDTSPQGNFCLTPFKVSPHNRKSSKKFSFKVWNDDDVYILASDRKEDMIKWMNKMAVASLKELSTENLPSIGGFQTFQLKTTPLPLPSPSNNQTITGDSSYEGPGGLVKLYDDIKKADIGLDGTNIKLRRSVILKASTSLKGMKNEAMLKLLSLNRILKDKIQELDTVDKLLNNEFITPEHLKEFQINHSTCVLDTPNK